MRGQSLSPSLRLAVQQRAAGRCEYCLVPEGVVLWPHEADHILAEQHGGQTTFENLAYACFHCNRRKGPNVASVDRETRQLVPLFNPRTHRWADHFRAERGLILPQSPIGRVTVELLRLNSPDRVLVRRALLEAGQWQGPTPER